MDELLLKMESNSLQGRNSNSDLNINYDPFRREFYFFYGSLMDLPTLAAVLKLPGRPELFSAKVVGYQCMLWGEYPALLDGAPDAPVYGMAYEVRSRTDRERLKIYETGNYKISSCQIEFGNGMKVIGSTFKWSADRSLLREGTFDLKDWRMNKLGL